MAVILDARRCSRLPRRALRAVIPTLPAGLIVSLAMGCANLAVSDRLAVDALEQRCQRPSAMALSEAGASSAPSDPAQGLPPLSADAVRIARAIGIDHHIAGLAELRERSRHDVQARLAYLEQRQHILERLLLVSFQISGTLAELDCEASRAEHLANSLEEVRDSRIRRFTLIAIIGDALVGILAGGLSLAAEETASAAAAITGGTIATTFGIGAMFDATYHEFHHERNLLTDIWMPRPAATDYPIAVWRYLTLSSQDEALTPREELVTHWDREGLVGEAAPMLYFGPGGRYEIDDLRRRVVMLEMVKAQVNTMNQQLDHLLREVLVLAPAASGSS